jgi:AcrR family transcriptional regulator
MTDIQTQTRERILDSAERLFADHGFEGASIRAIVEDARVNLAAVHYHFKSKEALLEAVLTRRITVVNEARLQRLDDAEATAAPAPPSVENILRAFIIPTVELAQRSQSGATFVRLMSRMFTEPKFSLTDFLGRKFGDMIERFTSALIRALPQLPREVVLWRAFFAIGAMHYLLSSRHKIDLLEPGLRDSTTDSEMTEYLLQFSVAGMCAEHKKTNPTRKAAKSRTDHLRKH